MEDIFVIGLMFFISLIGYFILRYLDGDFEIVDSEILEEGDITSDSKFIGRYYITKITYASGRTKTKVEKILL